MSGAAARTGKEDEEKNKKQEKIREQEELLKVEDKKPATEFIIQLQETYMEVK